ncbi:hypothetical protein H0H92_000902 [Tricholoma furcatifolium]|nr:hypothetical protein H0H92_000902 [Tricholoma furcatifolium]
MTTKHNRTVPVIQLYLQVFIVLYLIFPSNPAHSTKEAQPEENPSISVRLQNNYEDFGMCRTVEGILVVHEHGHQHIFMLQIANTFFKLPGDYLKPGKDEIDGLKRRLDDRRAICSSSTTCMALITSGRLETASRSGGAPTSRQVLAVPKNMKLLAIPLFELYDNAARYGPQLSAIPHLLSRCVSRVVWECFVAVLADDPILVSCRRYNFIYQ